MNFLARKRVAHVSTFPPLRCGIASFVSDLIASTPGFEHRRYALHYGASGEVEASAHANVNSQSALAGLARSISMSDCDIVSLQHEFGIWGGREGENIHAFLDNLTKPLLSVVHTTFMPGVRSRVQEEVLLRLISESAIVVALTEASQKSAELLLGQRIAHMLVIPHGIPQFPYVAPPATWTMEKGNGLAPLRLITLGFFRKDKGLEVVLSALRNLKDSGHSMSYRIVGEPQRQSRGQTEYLRNVRASIDSLDLAPEVEVEDRYVSVAEQASSIQAAHVGIFAYQDPSHASSGTVPLVMGMGRPVLCTPFEFAKTRAAEGQGVFVASGFDALSIASALEEFMRIEKYPTLARATYDRTRPWTWATVGPLFGELYAS